MFAIILASQVIARYEFVVTNSSGAELFDELIEDSDEEAVSLPRNEKPKLGIASTRDLPRTEPKIPGPMQGKVSMHGPGPIVQGPGPMIQGPVPMQGSVPMMQGPVPMQGSVPMQGPVSPPNENGGKRWYVFVGGMLLIGVSLPICCVLYWYSIKKHSQAKESDEEGSIRIRPPHSTPISAKDAAIRLPIRAQQGERESTAVAKRRQHESTAELPLRRHESKESVFSNALRQSIPVKRRHHESTAELPVKLRQHESKESVASNALRQSIPVKRRHHVYTDSISATRPKQSKVKCPAPEAGGEGKPGKA